MEAKLLSCMAKVFLDEIPFRYAQADSVAGFLNESICFQLAYRSEKESSFRIRLNGPGPVRMYRVQPVAVQLPVYCNGDPDYLRYEPGLYPDFLDDCPPGIVLEADRNWRCLFMEVEPLTLPAGLHRFEIIISDLKGNILCEKTLLVRVIGAELPDHGLVYTRWFHCDALSSYYNVPVFSEAHWRIMENFLRKAVQRGINMVLTPIHTPPLDTDVGAERQTVQLTKIIRRDPNRYEFDFSLLDRWIHLCLGLGIKYFEMAHLYTQWGASAAPKIVALTPDGERRIFGWDTPACGEEYQKFLGQYLHALTKHLHALGVSERCYFHISDEPVRDNRDAYLAAKRQVAQYLSGFPLIDALSDASLWDDRTVDSPVAATDAIGPFLDRQVPGLWAYYCCGQNLDVSNSFIAMPGERTRILGAQLYKFRISGFLQWGYNFYFGRNSRYLVNPFRTSDGDGCWPAGDPFLVYPSADGRAMDSLRGYLTQKAFDDVRSLRLLESLTGREGVLSLLDRTLGEDLSFAAYPRGEKAFLGFRARLEYEIMKNLGIQ
jgi:hypothetical protein